MKKTELIKKISEEFNLDEIKVSEYFDNIFETLAIAFTKNKNVNISEFGRFKVKEKKDEGGLKEKTVLFSPVKKFANDVNNNFNELSPVQIRLMGEKSLKHEVFAGEFPEDEVEDIILIDFEDEDKKEEVLIPEESPKEEPQIEPVPKEEPTKIVEILIPEFTEKEIIEEKIPLELTEETKEEIITVIKDSGEEIEASSIRIYDELEGIKFTQIIDFEFEDKIKFPGLISAGEKIISEVTTTIKQEDSLSEISEAITEDKIEEIIELEIPANTEEKIKETELTEGKEELAESTDEIKEEKTEPEITEGIDKKEIRAQNIFESVEDIVGEEISDNEFAIKESEKEEVTETQKTKEKEAETPKSNLELEAELLKMLDERKKIIEEIKKLENLDLEDLIDLTEPEKKDEVERPTLYEDDSLDKPKQDIFVDENGKILENLLKEFKSEDELKEKPGDEISEVTQHPENIGSSYVSEGLEKFEGAEESGKMPEENIEDLENLFGSIYGEGHESIFREPKDAEPHLNNPEMNVFDKLLGETEIKEDIVREDIEGKDKVDEPENVFVTFKTEKTGDSEKENDEQMKQDDTEAIKTYDDIFNLIEPNGKKNGKKHHKEIKKAETEKKFSSPLIKLIITIVILILLIFISIYVYQRSIYKPPEETPQVQTADSVKASVNDSIVYADTNKTEEKFGGNVVYNEEGFEIRETGKGFFIHFGSFDNQFELAKKIKELKEKNINLDYEKITLEEKEIYKIVVGPYNSIEEAKEIILKL